MVGRWALDPKMEVRNLLPEPTYKEGEMKTGDRVWVKHGASKWMNDHGYWLDCMGESIDGLSVVIVDDYTNLPGNDAHWGVDIGFEYVIGINPQFLTATQPEIDDDV